VPAAVNDVLAAEGPASGLEATALVEAAHHLADSLLAPTAQATDQADVVPRSHLDALAAAGLCGLSCPPAVPLPAVREIYETLAGACGVTFFVWVQHHAPVRLLAATDNTGLRDRHLDDLCAGRTLGGVAFAYLRRPGPPAVTASRVQGGWRLDGTAPWVTSWGLAGLYAVAARAGDEVVFVAVAGRESASLRASSPLPLAAMNASSTVALTFDGLFVPDEEVISVLAFEAWQARDRVATAQPHPAVFGIAATACRLLGDERLSAELEERRRRSYALADAGGTSAEDLAALVDARAGSLELAGRAATALVASVGGRAMSTDHPAQRLLREAAFFVIQAQTPALRQATLRQLSRS
jgi:hypothetical protein